LFLIPRLASANNNALALFFSMCFYKKFYQVAHSYFYN